MSYVKYLGQGMFAYYYFWRTIYRQVFNNRLYIIIFMYIYCIYSVLSCVIAGLVFLI